MSWSPWLLQLHTVRRALQAPLPPADLTSFQPPKGAGCVSEVGSRHHVRTVPEIRLTMGFFADR